MCHVYFHIIFCPPVACKNFNERGNGEIVQLVTYEYHIALGAHVSNIYNTHFGLAKLHNVTKIQRFFIIPITILFYHHQTSHKIGWCKGDRTRLRPAKVKESRSASFSRARCRNGTALSIRTTTPTYNKMQTPHSTHK